MCDEPSSSAAVPDFWLGIGASTLGSIVLNLGLNVQRLAHVRSLARPAAERRAYVREPLWLLGFAIFLVGNLGDAVGLTFTPQSVITPIGSVSLVSNLAFARVLLGERVGGRTLGAVALIIGGVVAIVVSADSACTSETVESILRRWQRPPFVGFAAAHLGGLVLTNGYVLRREGEMRAGGGTTAALAPRTRQRLRFAYALLGSMYAAWTVLLTKSIGELLKATFRGASQLGRWEAYVLLLGALVSAPMQIRYLNAGLRHFEALFIVPAFYSFWCFGSIVMGALFFEEFDGSAPWQFGVFGAGVVLNVAGVALLAGRAIDAVALSAVVAAETGALDLNAVTADVQLAADGGAAAAAERGGGGAAAGARVSPSPLPAAAPGAGMLKPSAAADALGGGDTAAAAAAAEPGDARAEA